MNKVIILAAGTGSRFASDKDKLLEIVAEHPVIYYSLIAFSEHHDIDEIYLAVSPTNHDAIRQIVDKYRIRKVKGFIKGGASRFQSLQNTLKKISAQPADIILVHNGANPLPSFNEISTVIAQAQEHGAAICGHKVSSTVKEVEGDHIIKTHDRGKLFAAQTPQAAQFALLSQAVDHAAQNSLQPTDEAMLLESIGQKVLTVEADARNFKITTQSDLQHLRAILGELPADFRTGIGQDSHAFNPLQKGLMLGGLLIPDHPAFQANSDGDVILHAIFNACSQAIGEKSLGFYADPMCENGDRDSRNYLKVILDKVAESGFHLNSIGLMLEGATPKIDPIAAKIKQSLSTLLDLPTARIGLTATTGEHLTSFGQGHGLQCFAIVTLVKR